MDAVRATQYSFITSQRIVAIPIEFVMIENSSSTLDIIELANLIICGQTAVFHCTNCKHPLIGFCLTDVIPFLFNGSSLWNEMNNSDILMFLYPPKEVSTFSGLPLHIPTAIEVNINSMESQMIVDKLQEYSQSLLSLRQILFVYCQHERRVGYYIVVFLQDGTLMQGVVWSSFNSYLVFSRRTKL